MGVSHSVAEFTGKVRKSSSNLASSRRPALNAAALAAKSAMAQGAPTFLRGVGRKGAKIGVRYTLYGESKAVVRWYGPAHLVNNPTRPHSIEPKKGNKALLINGRFVARVPRHPGTRGKHFFERNKPKTSRDASAAYNKTIRDAVASPFK